MGARADMARDRRHRRGASRPTKPRRRRHAAVLTGPFTLASDAGWTPGRRRCSRCASTTSWWRSPRPGARLVGSTSRPRSRSGPDEDARLRFREAMRRCWATSRRSTRCSRSLAGQRGRRARRRSSRHPTPSYLFDLVEGPRQLVPRPRGPRRPGDRVRSAPRRPSTSDQAPLLVWAAHYAASANGRGPDRVGLANSTSLAGLDAPAARAFARGDRPGRTTRRRWIRPTRLPPGSTGARSPSPRNGVRGHGARQLSPHIIAAMG
jgi:hypothetical protein